MLRDNDVMGGLFLLTPGGAALYLSPDGLEIEELAASYDDFIDFVLEGDLGTF